MKRHIVAGLSILAVMSGVGIQLAHAQQSPTRLQDISVTQHSEHSQPGPANALAGIRIRLSPSDFGYQINGTSHQIPQIPVAAD